MQGSRAEARRGGSEGKVPPGTSVLPGAGAILSAAITTISM